MYTFFGDFKTIENGKFPYYLVQTHHNGCKNVNAVDLSSDKPKIISLGCSITYDFNLKPEDNLILDNSFSKYLNDDLSNKYSFLNMGIIGSGLKLQIEWFKHYYKNIKNIDTVILQISDYQRQPMYPWQSDDLYHHTYDFGSRILLKDFHIKNEKEILFFETIKKHTPCEIIDVETYGIEMVKQGFIKKQYNLIINFYNFLKSINSKLIILYYEYWDGFPGLKTLNNAHFYKIEKFCRVNNIPLLGKFSTNDFKQQNFLLDYIHLNSKGNKFLAEKIKTLL